MSSVKEGTILLLSTLFFGVINAQDYPIKSWTYVSVHNGDFDNSKRIKEGFSNHTLITVKAQPVAVPAKGPGPCTLLDVGEPGGLIVLRQLVVPIDDIDNVLRLKFYHFTGWNLTRQGEFNVDHLLTLKEEDFWTDPSWDSALELLAPSILFGDWAVNTHRVDGKLPAYGCVLACDHITITIPLGGDEFRDPIPYDMTRIGPKYPLINPPDGFVNPCDKDLCLCDKKGA
ncbi:hypothetical protein BsWGS_23688 [Bradybaena similaris]